MTDGPKLENRDPISDVVFRSLLDWYMVSDPWPLDDNSNGIIMAFLSSEAAKRGYDSWTVAYHEFEVRESDNELEGRR